MTKNERIECVRLKSRLASIKYELERGMRDFDCTWPKSILDEVNDAITILGKLKC